MSRATSEDVSTSLGPKGLRTRRELMDSAAQLIKAMPLRDISAADISRTAGVSIGTFYIYFENVEDLALALAYEVAEASKCILDVLSLDWDEPNADVAISRYVRTVFNFWDQYGTILRVRNLAADEGDLRFLDARRRMSRPIHDALEKKVVEARARGLVPNTEYDLAVAAVLYGGIDFTASFYRHVDVQQKIRGMREKLISAAAFLIKATILGDRS